MSFEANQGQTDASVKFLSRGSGYTLFLTASEAVLSLANSASVSGDTPASDSTPQVSVLRTQLVGANPSPDVVGLDPLPGQSNYFVGNDPSQWHTDVPNYSRVQYQNVYPGVDLTYHGQGRQLEYDFTVAPHADPSVIQLQFTGADSSEIDAQGNLVLHVGGSDVIEHAPVMYQEAGGVRQAVAGGYVALGDGQYGFTVGSYDSSRPLIIDPILAYSTYLGGTGSDFGRGIALDSSGNVYITGITRSFDFPTKSAFQSSSPGGTSNAFVTKLNPQMTTILYSTYIGGVASDAQFNRSTDQGFKIAVDGTGNAYVVGNTNSTDFPTTPGAFQTHSGGGGRYDGFVTKLSASGSELVYSTYLGGENEDVVENLAVDANGIATLVGNTGSVDFPTTPGAYQRSFAGGFRDVFVTRLNAAGTGLIYSTYLGTAGDDEG